ncbi:MAG TPA: M28 family peptidase [Bryobacteraceae bacterium]|nr:M28 family peptidase [Bryobacteraceae bacterium]
MSRKPLCALAALFLALASSAAAPEPAAFTYTPAIEKALNRISADSLRGNLSFLASDLLEGRDTASRGLDLAAEYIAAQFRKAGLEPAGGDGYFQNADFRLVEPRPETLELTFEQGGQIIVAREVILYSTAALAIRRAPAAVVSLDEKAPLPEAASVAGKVLFADWPSRAGASTRRRVQALRALGPALVVTLDPAKVPHQDRPLRRLVDASEPAAGAPWITVRDEALAKAVHAGAAGAVVSARMDAPVETPVKLRNVVGVLRGSDPALRDTCVLVTAHYDHIGQKPGCTEGDCIFNGANDNGSGAVSVIEIANALAALDRHPRRSIVFVAFFGEERGLLGSRYYARHPVFPLSKTVADLNLEQLGRTDSGDGPQVNTASFTGFKYSDMPKVFQAAGKLTGIKVGDGGAPNTYFSQSDNVVFAGAGIPAHTVCVAFTFPDYHGLADHWQKIDYANMARVDRMLALGVMMLAGNPAPPQWNEMEPGAAPYVRPRTEARKP